MTVEEWDTPHPAARELAKWFVRCGYVRRCDLERRGREGQSYKKGSEVRFLVESTDQLRAIRRLVRAAGFRPGKPFRKHRRLVQPVYGRPVVEWLVGQLAIGRARRAAGFAPNGRRMIRRLRKTRRNQNQEAHA